MTLEIFHSWVKWNADEEGLKRDKVRQDTGQSMGGQDTPRLSITYASVHGVFHCGLLSVFRFVGGSKAVF